MHKLNVNDNLNKDENSSNEDEKQQDKDLEIDIQDNNQNKVTILFPKRLEFKDRPHMKNIEKIFEKMQANIPLLELLPEMSHYAKFLKDFCTKKRTKKVSKRTFVANMINSLCLKETPRS
jgi:hypothetical protein